MKIIKVHSGEKQLFDTNNTSFVDNYTESTRSLTPLHHTHRTSDVEFLKSHFPPEHPILSNIGNSYYYVLGEKQDLLEQEAKKQIIAFGKSNRTLSTPELEESIQKALEVYSTNINKHFAMSHREIGARQLIISCIYALNKEQLNKVDDVVMSIARDTKELNNSIKR